MFYEENIIEKELSCLKCNQRLFEPKVLPCGDTICGYCVSCIKLNGNVFDCLICLEKHDMPLKGLPSNKALLNMLSLKPQEVYRSESVETLKNALNRIKQKIQSLSFSLNNGPDQINNHCIELRTQVQLSTELAIQQINSLNEELIGEINEFQKDCIKSYELNDNIKEKYKHTIKELDLFVSEWSQYLKQTKINDQDILKAINEAVSLNENASKEQLYLDHFVFNGNLLRFSKNFNNLNKSILGSFHLEQLTERNSEILTQRQMVQLMQLFNFPSTQSWKLIYRASRDGFDAAQFHAKCDKKPNTLVVIRSTCGNVFGGFTRADWSGSGVKLDNNPSLFSLINKLNKPMILNHKANGALAIFCRPDYGPVFGKDIFICNNSNTSDGSDSNLGFAYRHPDYADESNEAKSFLAGTYKFRTTEIEVYTKEKPL